MHFSCAHVDTSRVGSNTGRYLDSTTYFFSDSEDLVEEAAEAFAGALAGCTVPGSEGAVCHAVRDCSPS